MQRGRRFTRAMLEGCMSDYDADTLGLIGLVTSALVEGAVALSRSSFQDRERLCEWDASFSTRGAGVAAGIAGGCLLLVTIAMTSPSFRGSSTRSAAYVLAACVIHFGIMAAGLSPYVCVRSLGGLSDDLRPQLPLEYVFWITTAIPEFWALALLVGQHIEQRMRLLGMLLVLFATGAAVSFTEIFWLWVLLLLASCAAHIGVTLQMTQAFIAANRRSKDSFTHWLTADAAVAFSVAWAAFPVWWLTAQLSAVSPALEHFVWPPLNLCVKLSVVIVLVYGSFSMHSADIEAAVAALESQRKDAESRDQAKRIFMRYILHELRVPLQGGQLAISELLHGLESGELVVPTPSDAASHSVIDVATPSEPHSGSAALHAQYVEAGQTAALSISSMGKILDDFLSLAKIEDGRMELEVTEVDVLGWLRDAASVFTNALRAKRLRLRVFVAPEVPPAILVDGNRLRQVIGNYLSNAIKFSPTDSEVAIELRTILRNPVFVQGGGIAESARACAGNAEQGQTGHPSRCESSLGASEAAAMDARDGLEASSLRTEMLTGKARAAHPFLSITVTDHGPGISRQEVSLLFQPFVQIRAGEQQKGLGTGLGLSLCKSIVELMGGAVGVVSDVGHGSSFWLEIPLHSCSSSAVAGISAGSADSGTAQIFSGGIPSFRQTRLSQISAPRSPVSDYPLVAPFSRYSLDCSGPRSSSPRRPPRRILGSALPTAISVAGRSAESPMEGCRSATPPRIELEPRPATSLLPGVVSSLSLDLPPSGGSTGPLRVVTRVVIVDDVRSNRELFARLLRRAGADVVFTAEHGLHTLVLLAAQIKAHHDRPLPVNDAAGGRGGSGLPGVGSGGTLQIVTPCESIDANSLNLSGADDLVDAWFVDGNMPVMDGVELTRRLRKAGVRAPILAVTGNALAEDQVAFRQAGASTVLTKPCSSDQLHEALARIGCALPAKGAAPFAKSLPRPSL